MGRPRASTFAAAAMSLALAALFACGTDAVGVDACKRVEQVRCESAQACGLDLTQPVHRGTSESANVAACIRYYDDQCLHGIVARDNGEPTPQVVDACVDAIINGTCDVVKTPESHLACSWLVPVPAAPAAADAATE